MLRGQLGGPQRSNRRVETKREECDDEQQQAVEQQVDAVRPAADERERDSIRPAQQEERHQDAQRRKGAPKARQFAKHEQREGDLGAADGKTQRVSHAITR